MKKTLMLLLLASVSLISQVFAEEHLATTVVTNSPSPYGFSVNTLFMSRYYGSIVGGLFYTGGGMSFTDLVLTRKDTGEPTWLGRDGVNRFDLSIGQKLDSLKFDVDGGNEYDITVGRSAYVGPTNYPVHLDGSTTYIMVHPLTSIRNDVIETILNVDLPKTPLVRPYLSLYRFDVIDGHGSGFFVATGLIHTHEIGLTIKDKPIGMSEEYRFGWAATKSFGTDPGAAYHRLVLSLNAKLPHNFSLRLSWIGQISGGGQSPVAYVDKPRQFIEGAINWHL